MSDFQLVFDFLLNIMTSIARLYTSNFLFALSLSLVILKIVIDVIYKIRIKFFKG